MAELEEEKPKKRKRIAGKRELVAVSFSPEDKITIEEPLIKRIGKLADMLGYKVYLVGGYIRDYYLNKPRKDYDFTVVGDGIEFAKEVALQFKTKAIIYERYHTAMTPIDGITCEFVSTRKEYYEKHTRKPIVTEGKLEDDIRRRDFTINAMAASINKENFGNLQDPYNGKKDLEYKILRTPLDPFTTFNDDPLRMLRAARFAAQLGFHLDPNTMNAIRRLKDRIEIISQERIKEELLLIMASPVPSTGFKIMASTGLLEFIFPEVFRLGGVEIVYNNNAEYAHKDVFYHSIKVLDNVAEQTGNIWLRMAALLHDVAKPKVKRFNKETGWTFHGHEELGARMIEDIFRRMKFPIEPVAYVEKMVRLHQRPMSLVEDGVTDSAVRRLAFHAGEDLEDLFTLCKADITTRNPELQDKFLSNYDNLFKKVLEIQEKDRLREFQSPVRGDEIMAITNLPPSRIIGFLKGNIEEAILDGDIPNDYDIAKEYFLANKDKWIRQYQEQEQA